MVRGILLRTSYACRRCTCTTGPSKAGEGEESKSQRVHHNIKPRNLRVAVVACERQLLKFNLIGAQKNTYSKLRPQRGRRPLEVTTSPDRQGVTSRERANKRSTNNNAGHQLNNQDQPFFFFFFEKHRRIINPSLNGISGFRPPTSEPSRTSLPS